MGIKSVIGWHSFIDFYNEKFTNIPLWFLLSLFETNIIFYFCLIFLVKIYKVLQNSHTYMYLIYNWYNRILYGKE